MSSALDEDTQQTIAEGQETAKTVLRSVQKDLQKVFIVFLVGFMGTFYALRLWIWDYLEAVTKANMPAAVADETEIIAQTPFEVILLQAKIGLVVGGIVAAPVLVYFAKDGLREQGMWPEMPIAPWKIAAFLFLALGLLTVGMAYGYLVFFPVMFSFLASFGLEAGFNPSYSIVMWTEFIVFLSLSFGIAGQMPLFVSGLSYLEIVPYETFRDKWRYAIVAIFVFGALFSPPDPFTQIMWAVPLIVLYAFSLYLAKVVVTAKRGSEQINVFDSLRHHWNKVAGISGVGAALVYVFYEYGGRVAANDALQTVGSNRRILPAGEGLGVDPLMAAILYGLFWGVAFAGIALLYFVYADLDVTAGGQYGGRVGDPAAVDLGELDAAGVRAAPEEAFEALSEEESLALAQEAMDDDQLKKAQLILDRYDDAETAADGEGDAETAADDEGDANATTGDEDLPESGAAGAAVDVGDRASRAGTTFLDELTEDDGEDDIGGYYTDIKFIVDSLRSRSFRIVATFMLTMAATFTWLYLGGLGNVRADFLARLPAEVTPENVTVITLHPVEALIFMVKFSVLIGIISILPMMAYYAWPALRERGFVRGRRNKVFFWFFAFVGGMVGGFAVGYLYIAPGIISYLVADALRAEMIITYRINDFFWLIVFTTVGIGLLANVPILMLMLNSIGVPYQAMRGRWREVTLALLTFAAVFTPADIITMFLVTVPLMAVYMFGLTLLFVITLGGRRNLAPPSEVVMARVES